VEHARSKGDDLENKNSNLSTQLEEYKQLAQTRKTSSDNLIQRMNAVKIGSDSFKSKLEESEVKVNNENVQIGELKNKLSKDEEVNSNLKILQGT